MSRAQRSWMIVGALIVLAFTVRSIDKGIGFDNDASAYLGAAERILEGQTLYARDLRPEVHEYAYPPTLAILLIPIALLGSKVAFVIWCLLSVAAWCFAIATLLAALPRKERCWSLAVVPSLLAARLLDSNFGNGQANTFILLAFSLSIYGLARNKSKIPGAAIGTAAALKVSPIGFGAYFLLKRMKAACVTTVATVTVLAIALPLVVLGPTGMVKSYEQLFGHLLPIYSGVGKHDLTRDHGYVPGQSLRPLTFRTTTPSVAGKRKHSNVHVNVVDCSSDTAEGIYLGLAGLVAGLGFVAWCISQGRVDRALWFDVSLAVLVMLLASPYARKATFVLLIIPFTDLLRRVSGLERRRAWRCVAQALVLFAGWATSIWLCDGVTPLIPLAIVLAAGIYQLLLKSQERICFSLSFATCLVTLSAPGLVQGWLANRMLAFSAVGHAALILFVLYISLLAKSRRIPSQQGELSKTCA